MVDRVVFGLEALLAVTVGKARVTSKSVYECSNIGVAGRNDTGYVATRYRPPSLITGAHERDR